MGILLPIIFPTEGLYPGLPEVPLLRYPRGENFGAS